LLSLCFLLFFLLHCYCNCYCSCLKLLLFFSNCYYSFTLLLLFLLKTVKNFYSNCYSNSIYLIMQICKLFSPCFLCVRPENILSYLGRSMSRIFCLQDQSRIIESVKLTCIILSRTYRITWNMQYKFVICSFAYLHITTKRWQLWYIFWYSEKFYLTVLARLWKISCYQSYSRFSKSFISIIFGCQQSYKLLLNFERSFS
jgi:hypothetical protein